MRRRSMPNLLGDYVQLERRQEILERIMQVIGFSPENPFTLYVNDGTYNRVLIGKINGDYGIKIVDNAGNSILLANGTIVADAIKTGTLDCDLIKVANLSAGDISTGTLSADFISGGILNCGLMTVSNLNAGSITAGTFVNINSRLTAQAIHGDKLQVGTVDADRIVADSITAGQIASHTISGDEIAFGTLTGDHINARTIQADRIQTNSLTTTEINYMSGSKLTGSSVYGDRIVNSVSLAGLVEATNFYTPGGIAIGVSASASGILLQGGKNINWTGGQGSIYDVDIIEGYDDIRLYTSGGNDIQCHADLDLQDSDIFNAWSMWAYNYYNRSDIRLKDNVESLQNGMNIVMALRPVSFSFKMDRELEVVPNHFGLIAQEVENIIPDIVKEKNQIKSINYNEIIPFLIKAIQELKEEINLLKA